MRDFLIKVAAFFTKEFHDVRRQPRLMLSLIGGPLLVLAAFGATFRSSNPFIRTVLVWPEEGIPGLEKEEAVKFIEGSFALYAVVDDEEQAMQWLNAGQVDVVQIVPSVKEFEIGSETRPEIRVISRTIDPNAEAWTRSLAYSETNYINREILSIEASQAQDRASEIQDELDETRDTFITIRETLDENKIDQGIEVTVELQGELNELLLALPPESLAQANLAPELSKLYRDIHILSDDLKELERALRLGQTAAQEDRLDSTIEEIESLQATIKIFIEVPAVDIISPIRETYTNLRGGAYSLVVFYAPSVLALLVQQMSITLASLGLVRERQMGSFEMFRVAPLRFIQLLLGKSLAYILYVVIAGAVLTGLMSLLNVPLPADVFQFVGLLLLFALASVGIGFLISAISRTDSQAIQLTMLMLLLSVFFTGFFLPITGFALPAWIIAGLIPMTYAIQGFQDVMLEGLAVGTLPWIGLSFLALLAYSLVLLIMRRQYRKVLD